VDWKLPDVNILVKFYLGTALPNTHFKTSAFFQHWFTLQSPGWSVYHQSRADTYQTDSLLIAITATCLL